MALLFMDSFDHYVTADMLEKWTGFTLVGSHPSPTISTSAGRHTSSGVRFTPSENDWAQAMSKSLTPGDATAIVGVGIRLSAAPSQNRAGILQILSSSTSQVSVSILTDMSIVVLRGNFYSGTVLGTASSPFPVNSFAYLELKVLLSTTVGTINLYLDGVSVLSLTGLNTAQTGTGSWSGLALGHVDNGTFTGYYSLNLDFDDLYVSDGSGSAPWNTVLGDCRVDTRIPTAAGATTGWTPLAGANYAAVDDAAPDDDTTYTSTSTTGAVDTFVVQDAPVVGATLYGIQHCLNLKKMDAGTCTVAPVVRHSSVDYAGTNLSPATSYAYGLVVQQTNPGTSAQWTEAGFNAAEFGYKRTA